MLELTIRLKPDGTFDAAHKRDALGTAYTVDASELPDLINIVNTAAIARVGVLLVEADASNAAIENLEVELSACKTRGLQASKAVDGILNNPDLNPEQKTAAIRSVTQDIQANERERQRLAALENLAKAQAEAAKYVD